MNTCCYFDFNIFKIFITGSFVELSVIGIQMDNEVMSYAISMMLDVYRIKRSSPRMEPQGTPKKTEKIFDEQPPSIIL